MEPESLGGHWDSVAPSEEQEKLHGFSVYCSGLLDFRLVAKHTNHPTRNEPLAIQSVGRTSTTKRQHCIQATDWKQRLTMCL